VAVCGYAKRTPQIKTKIAAVVRTIDIVVVSPLPTISSANVV
jgi:hypothetical protein